MSQNGLPGGPKKGPNMSPLGEQTLDTCSHLKQTCVGQGTGSALQFGRAFKRVEVNSLNFRQARRTHRHRQRDASRPQQRHAKAENCNRAGQRRFRRRAFGYRVRLHLVYRASQRLRRRRSESTPRTVPKRPPTGSNMSPKTAPKRSQNRSQNCPKTVLKMDR